MTDSYTVHPAVPLIKKFEGFKASPYWDVNHYRVGYGSDTITKPDGSVAEVQPGMNVSEDDAHRDLTRRVGEAQSTLKSQVGDDAWNKLGPNGQASLTSVYYNYGHLPWQVQNAASSGDPAKTASAIAGLSGDNNGVNALRRQTEANATLGLGETASGRFGLNGAQGTTPAVNRPNVSGSDSNSGNGGTQTDLLSQLLNGGKQNKVPAYVPNDGKSYASSPLEGMIRSAAGQGTYTPPFVAKMNGLTNALQTAFGGTTGQGSAPAPAMSAASANASPADATPPDAPPPASAGNASAGGGYPIRSDLNGNPVVDVSQDLPTSPNDPKYRGYNADPVSNVGSIDPNAGVQAPTSVGEGGGGLTSELGGMFDNLKSLFGSNG